MDQVTAAVRQMYERFPYPSGTPVNRVGSDIRLVLSYLEQGRQKGGCLQVLDAGCGRGIGVLGAAALQPDVHFLGIDCNRVALAEATATARRLGLRNIEFRECDLMELSDLDAPPGGFDVIFSSGVIHHLSDPQAGLGRLRELLSPHGAINLMVYARYGRAPLLRIARAIDLLFSDQPALDERLDLARAVAAVGREQVLAGSTWQDTCEVDDVEFVDRCLNVNETSYQIDNLWDLLAACDLSFVRWLEPADWSVEQLIPAGALRDRLTALSATERFRFVEQVFQRPSFELIAGHVANEGRRPLQAAEAARTSFALNPEVSIGTEVRNTPAGQRTEKLYFVLRTRDPRHLAPGPISTALMLLRDMTGSFRGEAMVRRLGKQGVQEAEALAVITELCRHEVLFRPHRYERE